MHKVAVIPGDGIGTEVTAEAVKVLEAVAQKSSFQYETIHYPFGSDHYLETGILMPDRIYSELSEVDAVFLGAIGDPRVETGLVERAVVGGIRFDMDLYINLRPITLFAEHLCPLKEKGPEDIDFIVVRENTEDASVGSYGFFKKGTVDEVATQQMIYTRKGVERAVRYAFELARTRDRKKRVTLVDKANAVRGQDIWTRTFAEVGVEYPDIEKDHAYVDAACMWMIKNPEHFDVIVTTNIFGDIVTDLGAMLQGGMGIAACGNIHPGKTSMFEPIHGSAPKYRGQNVANPVAAIMAMQMLLDYVGEADAAARIEAAVRDLLTSRRIPSLGADSGLSTTQIGQLVIDAIAAG